MIETTVVGSYPAKVALDNLIEGFESNSDPFLEAIKQSVNEQMLAGIDIVTTGQPRTDMISEFTRKIVGIRHRNGDKFVVDRIGYKHPITLDDLEYSRQLLAKSKKLKGILTGPYTLAKSCTLTPDSAYKSTEELSQDFAKILNTEARAIQNTVDMIQIDEPFFSQEYPDYGKDLISIVREGINVPIALHVCGDVSNIFEKLTSYPVDILDHEFSTNSQLLDNISKLSFEQRIGFGCVNSFDKEVESIDEIARRIEKAVKLFGEERIIVDPDCGLRHMPREVAYNKLHNMVLARNLVIGIEIIDSKRKPLTEEDWDQRGYFFIQIDQNKGRIQVEHYNYGHVLNKVIYGKNAESLLHTILDQNLTGDDINGKRHYGYLATELQKAEIALKNSLEYTQDKKLVIK